METLAQLDVSIVAQAAEWERLSQLVILFLGGPAICIQWAALLFLLPLSAVVGAAIHHVLARRGIRRRDGESIPGELTMLRAVVASLPDTIFVKDVQSRFLLANQAAAKNMGAASGADLLGKTDFDFFPEELAAVFLEDERKVLESGRSQLNKEELIGESDGQKRCLLTTKVPLFDDTGRIIGLIGVGRNITALKAVEAQLKRVRDELAFKAAHDSLTSLLNRDAILESLERELARSVRENSSIAVLLADLDHFKSIIDIYGHPTGDEVLCEVARRFLNSVRVYDLVGRYGGEEFLIVLPSCCAAPDAMARAEQLRANISSSPILTARGSISITASVGAVITGEGRQTSTVDVIREVDAALYAAKDAGRNRCCLATFPAIAAAR
jgi:diguanylate cyclase (GGDEF)-like protein/PAS domain S-box-containing protein